VPEVPALSGVVETLFAVDGPLARALPAFEPRAGQVDMAAAVARAFEQGGVLLAEAGTR
jgi:ATP-dependent DNA helicase DinG